MPPYSASSVPNVRSARFQLPSSRVLDWHPDGPHVVAFNNALSIFFPLGENFFIDSVRAHRHVVLAGTPLEAQVEAFCRQEAFHSREHELYNDALRPYLPVAFAETVLNVVLGFFKRVSWALCLAGTVGLEHMTSTLGATLLMDGGAALEGCEPHFEALWRWHALEECEHKAVAFDVFEAAYGKGVGAYALRVFGFLVSQLLFFALFAPLFLYAVVRAGALLNGAGWLALFRHHCKFGRAKFCARLARPKTAPPQTQ
jgi:predicted metal-dependent hydrolase